MIRLLPPLGAVALARQMEADGHGLLAQWSIAGWPALVTGFVLLDLVIYVQHRMFHRVPLLWRLHRMHHADRQVDASTGLRFHPLEMLLSAFIKLGAVRVLGPPAASVVAFEIALNATSLFNHGQVFLPRQLEPVLRWLVVTPEMHRIHHSIRVEETNSNFGFNLPWWDRLLATYRPRAAEGDPPVELGLLETRGEPVDRLAWMMIEPVKHYPRADQAPHGNAS